MSRPLLSDVPLVARHDDDGDVLELLGRSAGPAGALGATVVVGGLPVEVDVDAADAELVSVRVPLDQGRVTGPVRGALSRFVSDVDAVQAVAGTGRSRRLPGHEGRNRGVPSGSTLDRTLWQMVAAADDTLRPTRSDLQRALTSLAAFRSASQLGVQVTGLWDVSAALAVLAGVSGVDLVGLSSAGRAAVVDLLAGLEVGPGDASVVRMVLALLRSVDGGSAGGTDRDATGDFPDLDLVFGDGRRFGATAELSWAVAGPVDALTLSSPRAHVPLGFPFGPLPVASHSLPGVDGARSAVESSWVCESNVEVRVPGWAGRGVTWWARVRDSVTGTFVALAPLVADDSDLVGLLLVPPAGDWVLDVVDRVDAVWPGDRVGLLCQASGQGQAAARAERVGDPSSASRWRQTARAHERAGDPSRAKLALARADGRLRQRPAPAHVGDFL